MKIKSQLKSENFFSSGKNINLIKKEQKPIAKDFKVKIEHAKPDNLKLKKTIAKTKPKVKNTVKQNLKSLNIRKKLKEDATLLENNDNKKEMKTSKVHKNKEKNALSNAPPFNIEEFYKIFTADNIKKVVELLTQQVSEECAKKKNQVFTDYKYSLDVEYFKIPSCPKRMVKLQLKHSLLAPNDEVCLIVKDLKRGSRIDFEPTIHHYEDLLKEAGVTEISKIIPFNQLKKEYSTYELKGKLSNTYEMFLCEAPIVGHVVGTLGKKFQKPRLSLHAVRLNGKDLKKNISNAIKRTCYIQGQSGTLISIPVGSNSMTANDVSENIFKVVEELKQVYPGGLENIRSMHVKINILGTSSLPIYVSLCRPPKETPVIIGPREKKMKALKDKANKILTKFSMTEDGKFIKLEDNDKKNTNQKRKAESDEVEKPKKKKLKKNSKLVNNKTMDNDSDAEDNIESNKFETELVEARKSEKSDEPKIHKKKNNLKQEISKDDESDADERDSDESDADEKDSDECDYLNCDDSDEDDSDFIPKDNVIDSPDSESSDGNDSSIEEYETLENTKKNKKNKLKNVIDSPESKSSDGNDSAIEKYETLENTKKNKKNKLKNVNLVINEKSDKNDSPVKLDKLKEIKKNSVQVIKKKENKSKGESFQKKKKSNKHKNGNVIARESGKINKNVAKSSNPNKKKKNFKMVN